MCEWRRWARERMMDFIKGFCLALLFGDVRAMNAKLISSIR